MTKEEAIAWLEHHFDPLPDGTKQSEAVSLAIKALEQEPKTGHWIEYTRVLIPEPFNSWEQAWYCSECGYGNQECVDGSAWLEWKYCPNCGARMAESEE